LEERRLKYGLEFLNQLSEEQQTQLIQCKRKFFHLKLSEILESTRHINEAPDSHNVKEPAKKSKKI